jgi:ATP-dependent DNA ligase
VRYDKVQGNRFRHGTRLLRFRDDKDPEQCTWREVRSPPTAKSLTVRRQLRRPR